MADSDVEVTAGLPTHITDLEGISGRLRLDIGDKPVAVLEVHDGDVVLRTGNGAADAVAACDSEDTLAAINRGQLNPIVAALQHRVEVTGDRAFAIKVILGLQEMLGARGAKS